MENKEQEVKVESTSNKKNNGGMDMKALLPLLAGQNPQMASILSLLSGDNNNENMIKVLGTLMTQKPEQPQKQGFKSDKIDLSRYHRID